jgi:hypothetical protein
MTALAWATYGLILATVGILAGALFTAIGRTDALRVEMNNRIDALGSELRAEMALLREELREEMRQMREEMREMRAAILALDRRLTATGG